MKRRIEARKEGRGVRLQVNIPGLGIYPTDIISLPSTARSAYEYPQDWLYPVA